MERNLILQKCQWIKLSNVCQKGARCVGFEVFNIHDWIMKLCLEDGGRFCRFLSNGGLEKNVEFQRDKQIIVGRMKVEENIKESWKMEVTRTANYLRPKSDLIPTLDLTSNMINTSNHNCPIFKERIKFNLYDILASPQYKRSCGKAISKKE